MGQGTVPTAMVGPKATIHNLHLLPLTLHFLHPLSVLQLDHAHCSLMGVNPQLPCPHQAMVAAIAHLLLSSNMKIVKDVPVNP